jgi:hypothetical protein
VILSLRGNFLRRSAGLALVCLMLLASPVQSAPLPGWSRLRFLLGEWISEASGAPGKGTGTFSFALDLQQRVLVRRSHSEFSTTKNPKAVSHDDLMIIYAGSGKQPFRATLFDHEGRVVEYAVNTARDRVTFVSQPAESAPRYRLTYRRTSKNKLGVLLEVSSSGRDGDFKPHLQGTARRLFRPGAASP